MRKLVKFVVGAVIVVLLAILVSACAGETHQSAPDPRVDHTAGYAVVQRPDGFRNVAETCDSGGNMLLVTSRGNVNDQGYVSGIAVILHDPRCAK